ncbi:unnamed protein product [Parnassius apollo]|uniref:(apollo) hypothetical protein n=1 Tax=Parnassius apollo TaxID=110799 RepID=A0A8S3W663_PARAO|nr:unnamed protein product [Parnassius apollo]
MDGHTIDQNDSDSGESWTILEHSPIYGEDAPDFPDDPNERHSNISSEKDEDTDGISIISDSDRDIPLIRKNIQECNKSEGYPTEKPIPTYVSSSSHVTDIDEEIAFDESVRVDDDFLIDSNGKLKTYVHRRNKRLSTVLNIIMLGSVITAAGVAIGHMWGAKNDCTVNSTPSVNKILSNLYKLQEENAYLRNKLKELTLLSTYQMQQQKMPLKQQRCKKVFEEPLNSKNANKLTKCLDTKNNGDEKFLESHLVEPLFEKELLNEINKLKNVYQQNKSWLDDEISRRIKYEGQHLKNVKRRGKPTKLNKTRENKAFSTDNTTKLPLIDKTDDLIELTTQSPLIDLPNSNENELHIDRKLSYADSLKIEQKNKNILKREVDTPSISEFGQHIKKKRMKKDHEYKIENIVSEDEIKKDDRYNCRKCKNNKKNDKWRKKQKRKYKYEQFEINSQTTDYDDSHVTFEEKGNFNKILEKSAKARSFKESKYKTDILGNYKENSNTEKNISQQNEQNENITREPGNLSNWYEKRAFLRNEYRKNLEKELLDEKSTNDSGWYFRRMKRREQCRAKANNGIHKKLSKLNMNIKTKY